MCQQLLSQGLVLSTLAQQIGDTLSRLYPHTLDFSSLCTEVVHSGHIISLILEVDQGVVSPIGAIVTGSRSGVKQSRDIFSVGQAVKLGQYFKLGKAVKMQLWMVKILSVLTYSC